MRTPPVFDLELQINRDQTTPTLTATLRATGPRAPTIRPNTHSFSLDQHERQAFLALASARKWAAYGWKLSDLLFAGSLRDAWISATARERPLRVRFVLPQEDDFHAIYWELLIDPQADRTTSEPLFLSLDQRYILSRWFPHATNPLQPPLTKQEDLRAVIAVANPAVLAERRLEVLDVDAEIESAGALRPYCASILDGRAGNKRAGSSQLVQAIHNGAHLLYLVCHGEMVQGKPFLWLDTGRTESYKPVDGHELVRAVKRLQQRPLLMILAVCASGGNGGAHVLSSLGPQLVQAGVGAVLAFDGQLPMRQMRELVSPLLEDLLAHGQIDLAVAWARSTISAELPWWRMRLWMGQGAGSLWREAPKVVNLPPPAQQELVGRDADLQELAARFLPPKQRITALVGMPGVGKTLFALTFARRNLQEFPGGLFWLTVTEQSDLRAELRTLGDASRLQITRWNEMNQDERLEAVQRTLAEPTPRLLILDNVSSIAHIAAYLPRSGGTRVLITTRDGVMRPQLGIELYRLGPLKRPDSKQLLLSGRAARLALPVEALLAEARSNQAAEEICTLLGDLPLALALAAAYLEQRPTFSLHEYAYRLQTAQLDERSLMAEMDEGLRPDQIKSVKAAINLSYQQLDMGDLRDRQARKLLEQLALLAPEPIPIALTQAIATSAPGTTDHALGRLAELGLINWQPTNEVTIHRLIQRFVMQMTTEKEQRRQEVGAVLHKRLQRHNQQHQFQAASGSIPHYHAFLNVAHMDTSFVALLSEVGYWHWRQGGLDAAEAYYRRAVNALSLRDRRIDARTAELYTSLGQVLKERGNYAEAEERLKRAIQIWGNLKKKQEHVDPALQATSLINIAGVYRAQKQLAEAKKHYSEALEILQKAPTGNESIIAPLLNNIGSLLRQEKKWRESEDAFSTALRIAQGCKPRDDALIAAIFYNQGMAHRDSGRRTAARADLNEAYQLRSKVYGFDHQQTRDVYEQIQRLEDAPW
jgi:tetratricopeptide (TPR) repeat protein